MGVENGLQERHADHQQHQDDRKTDRILHVAVGKYADREDGHPLGAHGIGAEQLAQRKRDESHRLSSLNIHPSPIILEQVNNRVGARRQALLQMPEQSHAKGG